MNVKRIIIIFLSLAVVPLLWAKGPVKISGLVTDGDNEPLEFVTIKVAGKAIGTTSGLDGRYTLSVPEADTIRVVFSCIGFEESKRRLVDASGEVTLNVKMQPANYVLGGIEVTDYQKQMGTMQKIDRDELRLSPDASGGSVEALLTTMAGVNSNNEMSSQYSVRGGSYDENSVYINGIEVYRPQLVSSGQQEGLSIVNPDMVGAIGFSTGGFSAQYGDKMSSVLDITYRQPESFEGTVSASLMGASAAIGTSSRRFTQLHGVRYKQNSSLLGSLEEKGDYDPRFFDYQTSMTYTFSPKWKVSVLGNIAVNNYRFIPHNRTTKFGTSTDAKEFTVYFDGQEKDRFETYFGAGTITFTPSRRHEFSLLASGFLTNELVAYDISGEYWLDQAGTGGSDGSAVGGELGVGRYHEHARNRFKASVFALDLRGRSGIGGHNIDYGLGYKHETVYDRSREWELRDSAGYSLPFDPDALKVVYNMSSKHDLTSDRLSLYVMDTYRLDASAGYFNFNGGIRFSYWNYNREFLASPRVSVGFVPSKLPRLSLRFATGLYYQSPFYKEFRTPVTDGSGNIVVSLNDKIKSQRSLQFILGADYTFRAMNRPFKLSGEFYYKNMGNLIPYEIDNLKIVYSGSNLSSGYAVGLDMKLFGQFVPGTDSWISFSLMKTQETLNGVKVPRPTDQRYSFALFFTDYFPKFPKLKFNLRGIFSDGLPMTAPRGSRDKGYFRAPAYKRLDIGLAYALLSPPKDGERRTGLKKHLKSVWLGVDVFNLLDISNVSSYYWVTDVNDIQYAVPNYLTRRQFNVRLSVDF
ncbi:MAG: TonB-dependent receptor [Muribaculaceae bacterium]|nr:TonB-dependent receptor [Muribaculaceae bacterium]